MPLYEYECEACGERFELIRKFSDPPVEVCDKCGKGPVRRLVSSPAIQFKGSGWYITDYAKKSGSGAGEKSSSDTASKSGKATSEKTTSEKAAPASTDSAPKADTPKADAPAKPTSPSKD